MSWRSTSGTSSTKRPSSKGKHCAMAWMSCGQSAIASTGNIWTRCLSHPLIPSARSQKMGWTRWHMNTRMWDVPGWIEELFNAWGPHPVVAVCRMAPQAALLEQSLAVGHRHPAGSTTRARRAWSPSVPAGTLQETTPGQWPAGDHPPVHRAGKDSKRRTPRGLFALCPRGRPGTTEEGFCVSVLALMASEGFLLVSRVTSPFRAATTEGNRFTHSVDHSPEGSLISWAYWCPKRRSASVRLKHSMMPWSLWMSTQPRQTWTECFASSWLTEPMNSRPGSTWRSFGHRKRLRL